MSRPAPWTAHENRAICSLYHAMWRRLEDGKKLNKAALIRVAQHGIGPRDLSHETVEEAVPFAKKLAARSKGSVEAKLMNVTAILEATPPLDQFSLIADGYVPMSNYQAALKVAVLDYFDPEGIAGE